MISLLCLSHRRCLGVYVFGVVRFYLYHVMHAWSVCYQKISIQQHSGSSTATVTQYADNRVSSSCLFASNRGVCVCGWCPVRYQNTTTLSRPTQRSNTNSRTSKYTRYYTKHAAAAKAIALTRCWNAYGPPFRLATPPEYEVNPVPKGYLVPGICVVLLKSSVRCPAHATL